MCPTCGGHGKSHATLEDHVADCLKDDNVFCWQNCFSTEVGDCNDCDGEGGWVEEQAICYKTPRDFDY